MIKRELKVELVQNELSSLWIQTNNSMKWKERDVIEY